MNINPEVVQLDDDYFKFSKSELLEPKTKSHFKKIEKIDIIFD